MYFIPNNLIAYSSSTLGYNIMISISLILIASSIILNMFALIKSIKDQPLKALSNYLINGSVIIPMIIYLIYNNYHRAFLSTNNPIYSIVNQIIYLDLVINILLTFLLNDELIKEDIKLVNKNHQIMKITLYVLMVLDLFFIPKIGFNLYSTTIGMTLLSLSVDSLTASKIIKTIFLIISLAGYLSLIIKHLIESINHQKISLLEIKKISVFTLSTICYLVYSLIENIENAYYLNIYALIIYIILAFGLEIISILETKQISSLKKQIN
jgi:hypothetical protein